MTGSTVRFPVRSNNFDVACLFSVFTHFEASDIASYLQELQRVLRPGGLAIATWFLWEQGRRHDVENGAYPMIHQPDEMTLCADESDPLWAIAHHIELMRTMIADAGLEVDRIELGTWAQGPGPELQDLVVLRKPLAPLTTPRDTAGLAATLWQRVRPDRWARKPPAQSSAAIRRQRPGPGRAGVSVAKD